NAHQAMNADLASQQSECVLSADGKGRGFDARFFTGLIIVEYGFEALALRPTQIHAHEHLRPILRLGPTRARMNGDNRIATVILSAQQRLRFQLFDNRAEVVDLALQFLIDAFAFTRQLEVSFDVLSTAGEIVL